MNFDFYTLGNGVRVVLVPMAGVESVAVGVYVGTGSRYEEAEENGISHLVEHMVFKGTKKFPTHKETSYLEGLGAMQNAWTSEEATCFYCKAPADKWRQGLELVADLALQPVFPAEDLEIERGVVLEEINRRDDRPDQLVGEEMQRLMFGGGGLGQTVLGRPEVIKRLSPQDLVDYHKRQYKAGEMVVAIGGKIEQEAKCKKQIEDLFGRLPTGKNPGYAGWGRGQDRIGVVPKPKVQQVHLDISVYGLSVSDPRRFALGVLTSYLGQGMSSRLFTELREKRGLCYAVAAKADRFRDTGIWGVYAGLNPQKLNVAIAAIVLELQRVKGTELTEKELSQAKEKIRGPVLFSMEDPLAQMEYFGHQVLDRPEEVMDYDMLIERLMGVTAGEVQKVAQELLTDQNLKLAVVGPVTRQDLPDEVKFG